MSRFFANGSDSESESSEEEVQASNFNKANNFQFSDDEEEVKRVVRSTKEKRYENLTGIIKTIRNHKKIKDIPNTLSSFEDLTRAYTKALPVISKEENGITPRFYIRCLAELEDFINEVWEDREGRRNLSKNNSKSLGTLRQKVRKYIKDFEEDLARFREAPDQESDVDEGEGEAHDSDADRAGADSDDGVGPGTGKLAELPKVAKLVPAKVAADEDDSDDSIDWDSDTESETESSEDENLYQNMRERFLKRTTEKEDKDDDKRKDKRKEQKHKVRKRADDDEDGEWETVVKGNVVEKPKMFEKDAEIDIPLVLAKLVEIMSARGKKRTDRRLQIDLLFELRDISEQHELGTPISVKIHFNIISAIFDYNQKISEPMKLEHWALLLEVMQSMLKLLLANPDINMNETVAEEHEEYGAAPYFIRGCPLAAIERLDDEFTKLLKECDPHSNDYVSRLKDEINVVKTIELVVQYFERCGSNNERCRIYLRKIEHLYYKFDPEVLKRKRGELPAAGTAPSSVEVMDKLCKFIYAKDDTDRIRTRAILAHIYHHAMHDNWFQARDLVLMSHLQDNIDAADPSTRILYNRMMANLGLCAFRQENIKDAHHCLVDLMVTGKPKELLAQGLLPQRQHERSAEQEKIEKQRQMPFHMHINLELLECVYLVSAMLLEIPYIAAHEFDARRRMISKTFYQQLRSSERQSLVGPPESMREHVVAAAKAMRCGNWQACANFIVNKKMNTKVWDLFYESERVREMLVKFIKEESLRTYLFTYSNVYTSISIPSLSQMYELPLPKVHSIISKMIINEELMASLDDPSETVVMHRSEPSRLQALAMQFVDKVTNLVDVNEKVFDMKQGNFFQRGNMGNRDRGYNRNQNNQGGNWGGQRRDNRNQRNRNQRGHHKNQQQQQQQQVQTIEEE
ncbi:eukaryotic translation initiation factor 3 subunit C [Drosophila montana]|uniref:eukaryotic translation initiation factor 3 subunit C n=1 Tax=Drosophila montana TaxID=40370 RepID=UPI00313D6503